MTMRDPTDLRGAEEEREREELEALKARAQEVDDFKWIMAHAQGRRFLNRLLDKTGVFRSSFTGNSETFFREGMRNVGLLVMSEMLDLTPELYLKMLKENKTDERK